LCSDTTKLDGLGDAAVAAAANEIACRLDVQAVVDGAAKAEAEGTATIRPAPDTMTYVTALLPVTKGVGVYAARNTLLRWCNQDAALDMRLSPFRQRASMD